MEKKKKRKIHLRGNVFKGRNDELLHLLITNDGSSALLQSLSSSAFNTNFKTLLFQFCLPEEVLFKLEVRVGAPSSDNCVFEDLQILQTPNLFYRRA